MGDSCFVIVLLLFLPEKPIQDKKGRNDVWCNIKHVDDEVCEENVYKTDFSSRNTLEQKIHEIHTDPTSVPVEMTKPDKMYIVQPTNNPEDYLSLDLTG